MSTNSSTCHKRAKRTNLSHLSPEEKRTVKKQLNAESARRHRQRKQQEEQLWLSAYDENEKRIVALERKIDELSAELGPRGS